MSLARRAAILAAAASASRARQTAPTFMANRCCCGQDGRAPLIHTDIRALVSYFSRKLAGSGKYPTSFTTF
jgi:hypothetical protein